MRAAGHELYLVGGALLGVERNGGLLPHDDDVDFSFLAPTADPSELGLISYAMERVLRDHGLAVVRHSLSHLQIEVFDEEGYPDSYVDIFTGFVRDGLYHQPFALRGPGLTPADLVPTRPRAIEGVALPEPADPRAWLEFGYGPGWRVPDPSFAFAPGPEITGRFEGWFGSYNLGRDEWESHYLARMEPCGDGDGSDVAMFLAAVPEGARILDVGCGDGRWSHAMAEAGHHVVGVDYSHQALRLARELPPPASGSLNLRYLNLNDRAAVLECAAHMLGTGEVWCVLAHLTLAAVTRATRENLYLLLRAVLRGGGIAVAVNDTDMPPDFSHRDPSTWHLPTERLDAEVGAHGLRVVRQEEGVRPWRTGPRTTATVRFERIPSAEKG